MRRPAIFARPEVASGRPARLLRRLDECTVVFTLLAPFRAPPAVAHKML
jgi:hypothetical protein